MLEIPQAFFLSVLISVGVFALPEIALTQSIEIPVVDPSSVGMSAEKLMLVDSAMEDSIEKNLIPGGIVMIARHGKIVHAKAYGKMHLESDRAMEVDSIIRVFSMTKSIATAAALMLQDEGKLNVNDPVSKYISELENVKLVVGGKVVPAKRTMTIADLMRHTAGYGYGDTAVPLHDNAYHKLAMLDTTVTLEQMSKKLDRLPLANEPGTDWRYGISTDILGRVVEVAAGQDLESFLKERFFQPLDMRDTGFYVPADKVDRFAANYDSDGEGVLTIKDAPSTSRYLIEPPFHGGGGGLVSTARDYMRFLQMIAADGEFQGRQYLKKETVALMTTNQIPKDVGWIKFGEEIRTGVGFGFGFCVRDEMSEWDPQGRVGEYGWGGAASTHYWVSPKDDLVVITMEQVMPYSFLTEFKLKGLIYDAIE